MFQNLRQGSQVFLIYTSQADIRVEVGTIETTSAQMFGSYPMPNFPLDMTIRVGQKVVQYKGINGSSESAVAKEQTTGEEVIIACSKDAVNKENDRLKQEAINHLNMEEFYRKRVASCDNVRMQMNPEEVEKAQQQMEMSNMRNELSAVHKQLEEQALINKRLLAMLEGREASSSSNKRKEQS